MEGEIFVLALVSVSLGAAIILKAMKLLFERRHHSDSRLARDRVESLEREVRQLRQQADNQKERIQVLERIVTDQREDLRRQIDSLASR